MNEAHHVRGKDELRKMAEADALRISSLPQEQNSLRRIARASCGLAAIIWS
jgi:hypothetical protein